MILLLPLCAPLIATSCSKATLTTKFKDYFVQESFKDIGPDLSVEEFNSRFQPGDIIEANITLKNGSVTKLNLPYVNQYFQAGYFAPCLIVDLDERLNKNAIVISLSLWPKSLDLNASDFLGCDVTFVEKEKGGYKDVISLVDITSKQSLKQVGNDLRAFSNVRSISDTGDLNVNIRPNLVFRGSSPLLDNKVDDRHIAVDQMLEKNNISHIIVFVSEDNLKNQIEELTNANECEYTRAIYNKGNITAIPLGSDYFSKNVVDKNGNIIEYGGLHKVGLVITKIGELLENKENKIYICSTNGKDRAGFITLLLQLLAKEGSNNYTNIQDTIGDYMATYKNYYNISSIDNASKYQKILYLTIYRFLYALTFITEPPEHMTEYNIEKIIGSTDWTSIDETMYKKINSFYYNADGQPSKKQFEVVNKYFREGKFLNLSSKTIVSIIQNLYFTSIVGETYE